MSEEILSILNKMAWAISNIDDRVKGIEMETKGYHSANWDDIKAIMSDITTLENSLKSK
jgi:hypothetical protein